MVYADKNLSYALTRHFIALFLESYKKRNGITVLRRCLVNTTKALSVIKPVQKMGIRFILPKFIHKPHFAQVLGGVCNEKFASKTKESGEIFEASMEECIAFR